MNKNVVFTICAKNYFAQALTLKKSFLKNNPDCDFYIFLSDLVAEDDTIESNVIQLDDNWLPNWSA